MKLSNFKKITVFLITMVLVVNGVYSQNTVIGRRTTTIKTGVPFLLIGPDSRSGGMGESGVSTAPDANSMHWNPAKMAFAPNLIGVSLSYSPWLRKLINDINLGYLSGYYKLDDLQSVGLSILFFSLGTINFTDIDAKPAGVGNPSEFAISGAYSRKLSEHVSGAVSAKYIRSSLAQGNALAGNPSKPANSVAADVSFYGQHPMEINNKDAVLSWGVNISNIGTKVSYSSGTEDKYKDFIPTNLRLGPSLKMDIDDYNSITFMVDVNKLLVPTHPIYKKEGETEVIVKGKDPYVSVPVGMLQSFYDAPGGFNEELKEISIATGIEYWYDKQFAIRAGYFYEDATKGNRKFFTFGAGLRYNIFGLDFSYLVAAQDHPLSNTLRFTLHFNLNQ